MKRKNFATVSGLLAALSLTFSPAFAEDAHHPEKSGTAAGGSATATTTQAPAQPKVAPADEANKQLTRAQILMQRIEQTSDAAERQRLMQEHLRAMREGMGMMRGMGAKGGMGGAGMTMGQGTSGSGKGMSGGKADGMMGCEMMEGHAMMEKRMDMMQQMMEQMLQRDAAREAMPRP